MFASYGALTVGHREAVASAWPLDEGRRGMVRAAPILVPVAVLEFVMFAVGPAWLPYAIGIALLCGLVALVRSQRARAELRDHRRPDAIFLANLASRRPGAGREILDVFRAQAAAQDRYLCLEAVAVPKLVQYYRDAGFEVVGFPVPVGPRELVHMESSPVPV